MDGQLPAGARAISPDRSSANLKRTGPTISLMAMVATAKDRKDEPNDGNSRAMTTASPSVRPACDTSPAQDHLRSTGGPFARAVAVRAASHVTVAREPARISA